MQDETVLLEVAKRLHKENETNEDSPIPESDSIYKSLMGDLCSSKEDCMDALDRLIQARYVFKIVLSEGNPDKNIPDLLGFISAELKLIKHVTDVYSDKLQSTYEYEKYQRKDASTITKEIIPQMQIYRSTPMGKMVNILVMLEQFQHVIITNFWDYKDSRKRQELKDVIKSPSRIIGKKNVKVGEERAQSTQTEDGEEPDPGIAGDDEVDVFGGEADAAAPSGGLADEGLLKDDFNIPEPVMKAPPKRQAPVTTNQPVLGDVPDMGEPPELSAPPPPVAEGRRAMESPEYQKLQEMDLSGKWGVAVAHYGVQFLLRIHFRKYEFDTVIRLLNNQRIAKVEDLKYIATTLTTMFKNVDRDPPLVKHKNVMLKLRQMALNRITMIESSR